MLLELTGTQATLILALVFVGAIGLSYGLYSVGRWMGSRPSRPVTSWIRLVVIGLVFVAVGVGVGMVPERLLDRVTLTAFVLLGTAMPIMGGFAAGLMAFQQESRRRMAERTDEWLSAWEQEHSSPRRDD